jgi:fibronectin-binding autotransporter adhesin
MKTSLGFLLKKSICLAGGLAIALLGVTSASALIYQWNGSTSTNWSTAANWSTGTGLTAGPAATGGSYTNRLQVTNNVNFECVYDASLGTTVYGTNGVRGLVIGNAAPGNFRIVGGTFSCANNTNAGTNPDLLGNGNVGTTSSFSIDGGSYISAASGLTIGNTSGFVTGNLNINGGSANISILQLSARNSIVNLNGGTLTVNVVTNWTVGAASGPDSSYVRIMNFNGGKLSPNASNTKFLPNILTAAYVRNGGAKIDTAGFNVTIAQSFSHTTNTLDNATDGGLTKLGAGTLTLTAASSYNGPTTVSQGTLVMSLPSSSSSLVLASGSTLNLTPNSSFWSVDPASLTNSTLTFSYGAFDGNNSTVIGVNNLNLSGTVTVNVTGTGFPVTDLTLLTYNTKSGGGSFALGTIPAGAVATLQDTGSSLILHITTGSIQNLTWTASVNNNWQTNGAANWNSGVATYQEYGGTLADNVIFDDTLGGGIVNLTSPVRPASILVNSSGDYFFTGAIGIGGTNGIGKGGSAGLFISTSNTFSGPVVITNGTLWVNHSNALGSAAGSTTVSGSSSTLEIGTNGGAGIRVSGETVTISGTGVGGARGALRGAATVSGSNVWAGPVTIVANQTRIGTEDNGNLTVAGAVTDNGAGYALLLRPGTNGVLTMAGSGTYAGTLTFGDVTSIIRLGANNALSTNSLGIGIGSVDLNGFNQSFAGINNSGTPGTITNSASGASTLTIYAGTGASYSLSGDFQNGIGSLSVVKTGPGVQTLSGANLTYTGNTTINGGVLNLASANPMTTAVTVNNGGSLGGEGTTIGSITLNSGAGLSVDPTTAGSFIAGSVVVSGSPVSVSFTSLPANNSDVLVLTATGGFTGSAASFQAASLRGGVFYYTNSNTELHYSATATPASLTWKGNNISNPSFWDFTATNWINGVTADKFFAADAVIFDDTASSFNVAIQGSSVTPGSVAFNNTTNAYTVGGGAIAGAAVLMKSGAATTTLNGTNTYGGGTLVTNGGYLVANNPNALGSGAAVVDAGSTLQLNSSATVGSGGNTTFNTTLLGTGTVKLFFQSGSQPDTFLPNMDAFAGRIELANNGNTGDRLNIGGIIAPAATVQVDSGSTLYVLNSATLTNVLVTGGGNNGLYGAIRIGNGIGGKTLTSDITLTGDATLGFNAGGCYVAGNISSTATAGNTNTLTVGTQAANSGGEFDGVLSDGSNGGKLALNQTRATLYLTAANTYSGNTTISSFSTVSLTGSGSISNTAAIVLNNGFLDVSGIASFTLGAAQSLTGVGSVAGDVEADGTLIPGNQIGALTFNNNLTVAGNLLFRVNKSQTPSNSVINVSGTLANTVSGTLTVANVGTNALVVGDTFTLFSQPLTGGETLNLVGPAGVTFTNNLAVDGSISVLSVATTATNPTNITTSVSGSTLSLVWPADHIGWFLQSNSVSLMNTAAWFNVVGSDTTNQINININPANANVFYRLKH